MENLQETYEQFVNEFDIVLESTIHKKRFSDLVFLCIGTDRVTGDSFGPLVGYKLKDLYKKEECIHVIGDLARPVVVDNIDKVMERIETDFNNPLIVAIDSAVSNKNDVGRVLVTEGCMNIGSGLGKGIPGIGDISIKGVVSKNLGNPRHNFMLLQNTSLNLIMNMVDSTVKGIYNVITVNGH